MEKRREESIALIISLSIMTTRKEDQMFSNVKNGTLKVAVIPRARMNIFTNFSNMISSIISKTPSNLDETAIEHGHVNEFKGSVAPPSERSKTNTRKCNMNTLGIDPLVSCYPHEVLLELRDAFNASLDYPGSIDSTVDTTIVEALRDRLGHTEDLFLKLLDPACKLSASRHIQE
jgi:hypothetical protein